MNDVSTSGLPWEKRRKLQVQLIRWVDRMTFLCDVSVYMENKMTSILGRSFPFQK